MIVVLVLYDVHYDFWFVSFLSFLYMEQLGSLFDGVIFHVNTLVDLSDQW